MCNWPEKIWKTTAQICPFMRAKDSTKINHIQGYGSHDSALYGGKRF